MLGRLSQYTITHVYRESNKASDLLANMGISVKDCELTLDKDNLPSNLLQIIKDDFLTDCSQNRAGIGSA
ncbi:hypothetical protein SUGI_0702240 [Cryptomeria japonica]|nr:hypothetical protein SUGI_0702240 [Cryptomeria japonica]